MKLSRLIAVGLMSAAVLFPSAGHANPVVDTHNQIASSDCTVGDEALSWSTSQVEWDGSATLTCATWPNTANNSRVSLDVQFYFQEITGANISPALTGPTIFTSSNPALTPPTTDFGCTGSVECKDQATGATDYKIVATGNSLSLDSNRLYVMTTTGQMVQNVMQRGKLQTVTFQAKHTTCFFVTGTSQAPTAVPGCQG